MDHLISPAHLNLHVVDGKARKVMEQLEASGLEYNEHFEATAAKGLCWTGDGNEMTTLKEASETGPGVKSLWCLGCRIEFGFEVGNSSETES